MQISNNVSAYNVWKNYSSNVSELRSSMSKLSSGSRINSAGDDPSGLAMSERLRTQSRNTAAAASNVENKLNYLQTADSWMQKIHDMLGRMGELAVMANDGTKSTTDTKVLQNEFAQMQDEIQRITGTGSGDANAAGKFNGTALFQSGTAISQQVGADGGQIFTSAVILDLSGASASDIGTGTEWGAIITSDESDVALDAAADATAAALASATADATAIDDAISAGAATDTLTAATAAATGDLKVALQALIDGGAAGGDALSVHKTAFDGVVTTAAAADTAAQAAAAAATTAATVRIDGTTDASAAVTEVNAAIDFMSTKRSEVGAEMKRMEHTLDGLRSYEENISATESRIRDVDVAKETSTMSKYNILQQVGTAMLAQANQLPQGVLQLIQ